MTTSTMTDPDAPIKALATECAHDALDAAGPAPTDADGASLIPSAPLPGDWGALEDLLQRTPSSEERETFEEAYAEAMREQGYDALS